MNIFIRVDASLQMGSGHVMRCLTFAEALREEKMNVVFICRTHTGNLIEFLFKKKKFPVHSLPFEEEIANDKKSESKYEHWLGASWKQDADSVARILRKQTQPIDWMIVDHYSLDSNWEKELKPLVNKIMVIDDLADRPHDCDLLLNQNYNLQENPYQGLIPKQCQQLLGPQYSLLRNEFRKFRNNLRKRTGYIRSIFIFFGSSDLTNETQKALEAICQLNRPEIEIDVVIGNTNPHRKKLEKLIDHCPNIKLHVQSNNMAKLMSKADLAIGAGGSTTWERCCLGLPSLVISVEKNQEHSAETLNQEGYLIYLGKNQTVTSRNILTKIYSIQNNRKKLMTFEEKGKQLVDGNGVKRILSFFEKYSFSTKYKLRKAV